MHSPIYRFAGLANQVITLTVAVSFYRSAQPAANIGATLTDSVESKKRLLSGTYPDIGLATARECHQDARTQLAQAIDTSAHHRTTHLPTRKDMMQVGQTIWTKFASVRM